MFRSIRLLQVLPLAGLLALSLTAAKAQTVVNFDDLVGQGAVPDGYGGITWGGNWTYYGAVQPPYTPHSPNNRVYDTNREGFFTLNTPSVFNGAWFAGVNTTTVSFNLYDGANNLLASSSTLTVSDTPTFLASGYNGIVTKVGVVSNAPDFFVMDDVTYGTSAVPEPGSIAMFAGLGAAGAGFAFARLRRRRK